MGMAVRGLAGALALVAALLPAVASGPAEAAVDSSFGTDGITTLNLASGGEWPGAVAVQPDGKIVVVGATRYGRSYDFFHDFTVVRLDAAGRLDTAFGAGGIVHLPGSWNRHSPAAGAVALQPDGRIVVGGSANNDPNDRNIRYFALTRLHTNGAVDTGFGDGGWATGTLQGGGRFIALGGDGTILLAGSHTPPSFSSLGIESWSVLARYSSNGQLTASTTTNLGNRNPVVGGMALLPDGRILTVAEILEGGVPDSPHLLVWYRPDLSVEREVPVPARDRCRCASALGVVDGGRGGLVVAGLTPRPQPYASDVTVLRLTADGALLPGGETAVDAGQHDEVGVLAVQADGRVIVAGQTGAGASDFPQHNSLMVARVAVPATAQTPLSVWGTTQSAPLTGVGAWLVAANDPTASPRQVAPNYLYAISFAFAGSAASGLVALGTGKSGKFAILSVTPPGFAPQTVAVPFPWTPGRLYYVLVWNLGGSRWGAWVYDEMAKSWTAVGSLSLPASLTGLAPYTVTSDSWYGKTASSCGAYPLSDVFVAPPLAYVGTQPTWMSGLSNTVTGGGCTASVSEVSGWTRYRAGAR